MALDQLADELMDVFFDVWPVAASLLGVRDREDWLTDYTYTEAAGPAHSARLVVDTGLHAQGWSRQQVVASGVKAFHHVVLGTGALPWGVLDEAVQAWAGRQP
jgi:hypothetical protein